MQLKSRKVTPEKVVQIFKTHSTTIILKEAEKAVNFLYAFGYTALKMVFKKRLLLNSEELNDSMPNKVA